MMDDTKSTLDLLDNALASLTAVRDIARQTPEGQRHPFGSVGHMTTVIQNLKCARHDIANGITRNDLGYVVTRDPLLDLIDN